MSKKRDNHFDINVQAGKSLPRDKTYICAGCGGVFDYIRSDAEAWEEANQLWSKEELKEYAIVCDDCFQKLMKSISN